MNKKTNPGWNISIEKLVKALNKSANFGQASKILFGNDSARKILKKRAKDENIQYGFQKRKFITWVTLEYWTNKGFSEKEAVKKIKEKALQNAKLRTDTFRNKLCVGQRYNNWIILSLETDNINASGIVKPNGLFFKAQCALCEKQTKAHVKSVLNGKSKQCRECTSKIRIGKRGSKSSSWRGFQELGARKFNIIKGQAAHRGINFDLNMEYLYNLYINQEKKCALSGEPLLDINKASLDRIDSHIGYIVGNVQWVTSDLNYMKRCLNNEQFLNFCQKVVNFQKLKSSCRQCMY